MIGPFPGSKLIFYVNIGNTFGIDFYPLLGNPVQNIDGVKALFIWASPSEHHDPIVLGIVAH